MAQILTSRRDVPFELVFKYPLEVNYRFTDLSKQDTKRFQSFLNKVSRMTVQQVDSAFARKPDKNDIYKNERVYQYEVSKSFRIHVIIEQGRYIVIRLDPNHEVHK